MRVVAQVRTKLTLMLSIILIASWLAACSGPAVKAPVSDMVQPPAIWLDEHIVAPGETLYSIAWRYDLDHRDLARANGISRGFQIFPGQHLNLNISQNVAPARTAAKPSTIPSVTQKKAASRTPSTSKTPPKRSGNQTVLAKRNPPAEASASPASWRWPIRGKILASFQSNGGLNKGIDIGGKLGEPVIAAAGGKVVYSGNGLRGYGNLIIVKHNEKYLSAYAHNSELLVKEGQNVKAGEQIARVGSSGTDSVKLHFEIRYDGKPVNPLNYLPD